MGILAKVVKEAKDAAEHAEQVINELLIVLFLKYRPCKTFSVSIPLSTILMECSWTSFPYSILQLKTSQK